MSVYIKNLTSSERIYFGVPIGPSEERDLISSGVSQVDLLNDESLVIDYSKGLIQVGDGSKYFDNVNELLGHIKNFTSCLRTTDNRLIMKPNVRPINSSGYFTYVDDLLTSYRNIGGGSNVVKCDHKVGDAASLTIEQVFNVEGNRSWIFEGYIKYQNCYFNEFTFEIRPRVTPIVTASGTNFRKYNGLIIPATGNGDADFEDINNLTTLVSVTPKTDSGIYPAAYWNATLNTSTMKYENLTPAPDGKGRYNIFYLDLCLKRYLNRIPLLGSDLLVFPTTDPSELGSNMRCVYKFATNPSFDHDWQAVVFCSMYRERIS